MSLTNERVLIIGGTSGIGLGVAHAVAQRGGIPIVASRRQSSVQRALADLPAGARGLVLDVTDGAALAAAAEEIGALEHLVYTAGDTLELTPLAGATRDVVAGFLLTRFIGALDAVRLFAPKLSPGGSITLTSGTAAQTPGFGVLPVSLCGAMNAATTALAVELAPLRVNAVAPGVVRTPLWDTVPDTERQAMFDAAAQRLPLGRIGEVQDAAQAYVYCMEQRFGTGVVLTVDGGTVLV
ncbi:SDR family oxidoreductase [Mycolicibacterium cosmeticum]|uniref:SDR family oxidoreductase n=1 Tax=Mycolicibacterium cosmeticum TaxID=258533 RepID=UPI0032049F88